MKKGFHFKGALILAFIWNILTGFLSAFAFSPNGWSIEESNYYKFILVLTVFAILSVVTLVMIYKKLKIFKANT